MPSCDDDTWYLSESIGPTGLSTGASRVGESRSQRPLFTDPYAQLFDAAPALNISSSLFPDAMIARSTKVDPLMGRGHKGICA